MKHVGHIESIKIDTTEPLKLTYQGGMKQLMVLVGPNGSGKTFVMINTWCVAYLVNAETMGRQVLPPGQQRIAKSAQFVFDHSFTDQNITGSLFVKFESGITLRMKLDKGKVERAAIDWPEKDYEVAQPVYMSSQMRTFEAISHYLKTRRRLETDNDVLILREMVKDYKLYDVAFVERLIRSVPYKIEPRINKALSSLPGWGLPEYETFDVDMDRGDFFLVEKDSAKRQYLSALGKGHQAMINMAIGSVVGTY